MTKAKSYLGVCGKLACYMVGGDCTVATFKIRQNYSIVCKGLMVTNKMGKEA